MQRPYGCTAFPTYFPALPCDRHHDGASWPAVRKGTPLTALPLVWGRCARRSAQVACWREPTAFRPGFRCRLAFATLRFGGCDFASASVQHEHPCWRTRPRAPAWRPVLQLRQQQLVAVQHVEQAVGVAG
eukprot:364798-Chlamydomonas_euryale.AAC.7